MALITDVKQICDRLADAGWQDLMLKHGIDIKQTSEQALASALAVDVDVDRTIPGFEDFVASRAKGIEPGDPAASLLYHAFASPNVTLVPEQDTPLGPLSQSIKDFPTLEELDTIINYIFAKASRSLSDVQRYAAELLDANVNTVELAVAVFASEYRPASETPHQRYADLCHSRTGTARVGTVGAIYDGKMRGYFPFRDGDSTNTIRVLPCHYSTWLAVRSVAQEGRFGPARALQGDEGRNFWVPVHKLFDGSECLRGETLQISLSARHQNKKLERLHEHLENSGFPSGFSGTDRQQSPFINEQGLTDWLTVPQNGCGLLSPQPHPLAARATFSNAPLTFQAPPMSGGNFSSAFSPTLTLNAPQPPVRPWPEYAHVRFDVREGNAVYFGDRSDAVTRATAGTYRALNISDFTADGWVKATVSGLDSLQSIPAYSLIAAPDFFPAVDQREVYEWWLSIQDQRVLSNQPTWLQQLVQEGFWNFWRAQPIPLSDERSAPNITLTNSEFKGDDDTVTAIVTTLQRIDLLKAKSMMPTTLRHATLPDAAAGIFAPGWDTSGDRVPGGGTHLASYGLGSPFPEDAKLCAALSTFWPAVAPDTERTFFGDQSSSATGTGTVCPLTDEENGATPGSVSWDGLRGPRVLSEDGSGTTVRYPRYEQADYTLSALEGRFSIALTRKIDFREYTGRILATLRMYRALQGIGTKRSLHILSFRQVESSDTTLRQAQDETRTALSGPVYRFDVFDDRDTAGLPSSSIDQEDFAVGVIYTLFIGTSDFLLAMARRGDGSQARSRWLTL
ncbi:hypothetical protein [Leptothoe spongobia]|uniref:Uncharacterized protein n=1 Tax=Leptothoe spongobia TAU-MAC 1115 TaxID=1967444 RepID=A0A947DIS0_9CYAN|nr:hypothetical protein [Leptothoe spongobia]MBT9318007.1 hypothetical protein [Leptothoe spongobia TAU-MAC 1115]